MKERREQPRVVGKNAELIRLKYAQRGCITLRKRSTVPQRLRPFLSKARQWKIDCSCRFKLFIRWIMRQRRHTTMPKLPRPLVVTLTSYPPRFSTLALTIKTLLTQSTRPDKIILWIAEDDRRFLPKSIYSLVDEGLIIRSCPDFRSYKKLVPALQENSDCYYVTADDDVYYPSTWLSQLLSSYNAEEKVIVCHRARLIKYNSVGMPKPYSEWPLAKDGPQTSRHLFPTGIGGVLYPPGVFDARVTRDDLFTALCPTADDVWFYYMARESGASWRLTKNQFPFHTWRGSQNVALAANNQVHGENDSQILAAIRFLLPS